MPDTMTLAFAAVAVLALAGGVSFWLYRRRWLREAAAAYHHFRCPSCKRRIRFLARQVGHQGECSNCGKPVTFPPVSHSVE
jgi:ribosomal protein L37AE/L43A